MIDYKKKFRENKMKVVRYGAKESKEFIGRLVRRSEVGSKEIEMSVRKIIEDVIERGDRAVIDYTKRFDKFDLTPEKMRIDKKEIEQASKKIGREKMEVLRFAAKRITAFHEKQKPNSWFIAEEKGILLGQRVNPLSSVGLYVPGGKASYPSSVLMNALPARVAGVERIIMCTPTPDGDISPYILAAAGIAGVDEIYRVGGVQAVAAMAYGTETIPKVDKIVGPGNIYVAVAKRMVFGEVDIDMIAGPSEILIIADETANVQFVAADLLSQAEHDERAMTILVTDSEKLAEKVRKEVAAQLKSLSRKDIASRSLDKFGAIIIVKDLNEAVNLANEIAPEHLELEVARPFDILGLIKNAGAIFLGRYTPEAVGDYLAGPNHVLPTGGTARFFSPLSVDDFVKKSSIISFSKEELVRIGGAVKIMADMEGLEAHLKAVDVRMRS